MPSSSSPPPLAWASETAAAFAAFAASACRVSVTGGEEDGEEREEGLPMRDTRREMMGDELGGRARVWRVAQIINE